MLEPPSKIIWAYLRMRNMNRARSKPSVPQTTPAMVPKCSSRSIMTMELPADPSASLLGENDLMASQPGWRRSLLTLEKWPKCMSLSPTMERVAAWILRSYTVLVVRLFKYICIWKIIISNLDFRKHKTGVVILIPLVLPTHGRQWRSVLLVVRLFNSVLEKIPWNLKSTRHECYQWSTRPDPKFRLLRSLFSLERCFVLWDFE